MNGSVVAVAEDRTPDRIRVVAAAVADLMALSVQWLPAGTAAPDVLHALAAPGVAAGVLADGGPDGLVWQVVPRAHTPVVVVPDHVSAPRPRIRRALLPLDGSAESARAVAEIARLLDRGGVELIVLHVFDRATVPAFWDQQAHAHAAWSTEFLSRAAPPNGARIELRSGRPGEHVVRAAAAEDVDLIALGWSRATGTDRARTVREALAESSVPVLLLPLARS